MKHQTDVLPITNSSNVYGDTDPMSKRSVHEYKEHNDSQNFKQEVLSTGESRGLAEELSDGPTALPYTETSVGAHVHLYTDTKVPSDISNCQSQLIDGQAAAESSLQTSIPMQSQLPSSVPYVNKDSSGTSFSHLVSTDQPFASESTMPRSYLPELPPSVGNHSSNLPVGNSPFTNHIPRDYSLIQQHPQFPPPSTTSWNPLPPPPPFPFPFPNNSIGNTTSGLPSAQFQQNIQPPYSDLRYQASTGVGQQVLYHQLPEAQKSLYDANRFGPRIMPVVSTPMDQSHGPSSHIHPYMHPSPGNLHPAPDGVPSYYGLPGPAGDQYDPLSDSIEPFTSSVNKPDFGQMLQPGDSGIVSRTCGSNQLLDVDGNNKLKGSGGVQGSLSLENYEYGETADAEVGDVEDGSASNPQSAADMSAEEDEINQVKASGKTEKGKDSKSMKFFKIAIADFVKEVLKPSWRQGNMSKEAFKTIVKKTVDKVSAATGQRHIPKSREKIDHYINSQQRKLTTLVMGYVDKYVNA